eukprot:1197180-Rhodomonas_salina.4
MACERRARAETAAGLPPSRRVRSVEGDGSELFQVWFSLARSLSFFRPLSPTFSLSSEGETLPMRAQATPCPVLAQRMVLHVSDAGVDVAVA